MIIYTSNSPAENIPVEDRSVQLINACSAAHWFDLPAFLKEADRVLSPNGVVALSCHDIPHQDFVHPTKGDELRREFERVTLTPSQWFLSEIEYQTY